MSLEHAILVIMMALGLIPDLSAWYAIGDDLV